jgi:hypothetical protein
MDMDYHLFPRFCILVHLFMQPGTSENSHQLAFSIVKAWDLLQWNNVTVICPSPPNNCKIGKRILQFAGSRFVQIVPDADAESVPNRVSYSQMSCLTFLISSFKDYDPAMATVKMSQGNSVLLVLLDENLILFPWQEVESTLGFFILSIKHGLQKILTSREGNYLTKSISQNDTRPQRDISGVHMIMKTRTYAPFLLLRKPSSGGMTRPKGLLQDVMAVMAKRANFTYEMFVHPEKIWTANFPPNSEEELNETSGVVGTVFDGSNDIPLSVWIPTRERRDWVDFSFYVYNYEFRCFANADFISNSENTNLLMSPFTGLSWILISVTFVMLTAMRESLGKFSGRLYDTLLLLGMCVGLLELLLTAYYGGALTMFLASTPNLPFETQLDGMRNPDWTLLITNGDESFISNAYHLEDYPELRELQERIEGEDFQFLDRPIRFTKKLKKLNSHIIFELVNFQEDASNAVHQAAPLHSDSQMFCKCISRQVTYEYITSQPKPLVLSSLMVCGEGALSRVRTRDLALVSLVCLPLDHGAPPSKDHEKSFKQMLSNDRCGDKTITDLTGLSQFSFCLPNAFHLEISECSALRSVGPAWRFPTIKHSISKQRC